jgi:hypothetical protein
MSNPTHRSYEEALRAEQRRCDQRAAALAGLIARELERAEEIDRLLECAGHKSGIVLAASNAHTHAREGSA